MRPDSYLVTSDSTSTGANIIHYSIIECSVHVVLNLRAENLEKSDVTGKSDPYVVFSCQGRKYETKVRT